MPARNSATGYGAVSRTFHWLTALLILAAFPLGVIANDMGLATPEQVAEKIRLFSLHKTIGIATFAVALARILWALTQTRPVPLHPARRVETFLAEAVHWALYLALVVVPLSGWVHHAALDGFAPILWPLGQDLPLVPKSQAVAEAAAATHWLFTKILFATVALHIAGALKHAIVDRDLTMARMTVGTQAGKPGAPQSALPLVAALAIFAAGAVGAWQIASRAAETTVSEAPAAPAADTPSTPEDAAETVSLGSTWTVTEGSLGFSIQQMGAAVAGTLPAWTAEITYDDATGEGSVTVTIDLTQLSLGAVTDQAKGPEFFDVAAHPTAVFDAAIAPAAKGPAATGTLTLRGAERPVTLPFTLDIQGDRATMQGKVTLDRRDFGLGASYADEKTVGFAAEVSVALTATRQP
jgi:cytochrome b561/polyisoprenoid-binding protein YceI